MKTPFAWLIQVRGTKRVPVLLGAYVAVYAVFSLLGHYEDNVGSMEKLGIITFSISDREEWQPIFIIATHSPGLGSHSHANIAAHFFMPLICLDQHLCHPTKPIKYGMPGN
jgi:hypothetical protein